MDWTKQQIVEGALEEIGLASYVFDLSPEQLQSAMRKLDAMMATWDARGIKLGYALAATPTSGGLDQPSGVPDWAVEAVILNLGIRLAPAYGKMLARETKTSAKAAYDAVLLKITSDVPRQQLRAGVPAGAGSKDWESFQRPFLPAPNTEPLQIAEGGGLNILGD